MSSAQHIFPAAVAAAWIASSHPPRHAWRWEDAQSRNSISKGSNLCSRILRRRTLCGLPRYYGADVGPTGIAVVEVSRLTARVARFRKADSSIDLVQRVAKAAMASSTSGEIVSLISPYSARSPLTACWKR